MSAKNDSAAKSDLKLVVTRVINAPCHLVYRAWTDPQQMAQWFCPAEIECRSVAADLKIGGAFRIHMVSKKGDHIGLGNYLEIIPNARLKMTWQWEAYAMPDSVLTVEFEDLGKTTRLTLTHAGLPDEEDVTEHTHGWTSLVEKFVRLMEQNLIKRD